MDDLMRAMLDLNALDRRIVAGKTRMMELAREVSAQEKKIQEARDKARQVEAATKEKVFSTDRLNMDVRSAEAEVGEQERKLKGIKNQREFRVLSDRIKELKIMVDENESAVLAGMEELDVLRERLTACHDVIGEEELKLTTIRQRVHEEAETIKARHAELIASRQESVKQVEAIDSSAYQAYDHALKRTKGDPMSEMTMDGICQSCFRRQNSSGMNIVHIGKDVKNCRCQGCGRILYVKGDLTKGEAS